ncbi:helicase-associated domain-containing protein [Georgenia satyanarayanai]|uniref:helicase-associated domain-containing protein n=1 Tax=Georgenia satyanarayanai TaxID=860221 RepID=UPI001D0324C6|nr:helicase-associated domain-containing protein [Georgenia satyanarayanai]
MTSGGTARLADVVAELARRPDADVVALLRERPDLPVPPPTTLTALAARACSRPSVERVLAGLDQHVLEVAEAVCALGGLGPVDVAAVQAATGAGAPAAAAVSVDEAYGRLERLLLVVGGLPVLALHEALGPYPARLGPPLAALDVADAPVTTPEALGAVLADAPPAAHRVLDALVTGTPVGVTSGEPSGAIRWLLDHGVLQRLGATQVVLPLETGLAARHGRTHPQPHPQPPPVEAPTRPAAVVAAESTRAAEELVRLVGVVVREWTQEPAPALRSGGLGVRELRRLAGDLGTTPEQAAEIVEIAAMAGLVGPDDDGERPVLGPAAPAADWAEDELADRWVALAEGWLASTRMPWLVGTRDDRGTLRAALGPGLERGWAARLRRRVLAVLASLPAGTAPAATAVHAVLRWQAPRATPPEASVAAVLAEAELLGLTGAGALGSAGRALATGTEDAAAALARDLPEPVDEILVQGDLTAVVPGRPTRELAELLDQVADVESRGAALTVRFTAESVRRALDAGTEAQPLLERLAAVSRTPLPQALEYLVGDTARRHGRLRVGGAGSYLRTPDEATTRALLADPRLAGLGLREIAPTALVSRALPGELLETLRRTGAAPVLEGPGAAVGGRPEARRGVRTVPRVRRAGEVQVQGPDDVALERLVGRMRAGQERADQRDDLPATDPVHTVAALREAASAGSAVRVVLIGASGKPERRRVRPVSVEGGRVRMVDLDREAELVVAIHRISAVAD